MAPALTFTAAAAPRLYGIVDLGYTAPENIVATTEALLTGGAGIIQLRAKGSAEADIRLWAMAMLPLCRAARIPLIINDFPHLAVEIGADGVHIGQDDGAIATVRALVGPDMIIGKSTHSLEQAIAAQADGATYIGFGPLFPTPTKAGRPGIGLQDVAIVHQHVHIPIYCIGGIKRSNLRTVLAAGAQRVVIVSDLLQSPDIAQATRQAEAALH
jgi:thiamine-phosphate pyrophosphorylase